MSTTYSGGVAGLGGTYNTGRYYAYDRGRGGTSVENARFNTRDEAGIYGMVNSTSSTFDFPVVSDRAAGDAVFGYEQIWDYFRDVHGRTGWDGNGAGNPIIVNLGRTEASFGLNQNGVRDNGLRFGVTSIAEPRKPLTTIDIIGHEFTHGVTYSTAGLATRDEPGSRNESFSDIFGTAAEFYSKRLNSGTVPMMSFAYMNDRPPANYLVGEQTGYEGLAANGTRGIVRSLQDPPSRLDVNGFAGVARYEYRITDPSFDFGGTHHNCGIQNKAYYLLSVGGTHYGITVQSIERDKAEKIFFRTLTMKLLPNSTFVDARYATCSAASNLYGYQSFEWWQVWLAWDAVGVPAVYGYPQQ